MVNTYVWCSEQKASNLALEGRDRRVPGDFWPVVRVESERPRASKKPCLKSQDRVPTPTSQSTQTHTRKRKMTKPWGRMNTMGWVWGGVDQPWLRVKICTSLITRDPFHFFGWWNKECCKPAHNAHALMLQSWRKGENRVTPKFVPKGLEGEGRVMKSSGKGMVTAAHCIYNQSTKSLYYCISHI